MGSASGGEAALFRRLRLRLQLLCILVTGVILLGMSAAMLAISQSQLITSASSSFQSDVNAILYHLRSQTVADHTWISQTEAGSGLILHLELSGRPLLYTRRETDLSREALVGVAKEAALREQDFDLSVPPSGRVQPEQTEYTVVDRVGVSYRAAAIRLPQERGWAGILVLRSMAGEQRALWVQRITFCVFTLLGLVLLALFAWIFTRKAVRPLEESRRRQNEFIAAASHELRSPLAVVRASLSALESAPPERAGQFIRHADSECERMSRLVGDMLMLANADNGSWTVNREELEPETLLLDLAEGFELTARERGVAIGVSLPEDALPRCRWDRQRVVQALCVLIENGLSYTPAGGQVRLTARPAGVGVRILVADTGGGIPDEEKGRVFERFYRTDAARASREHYGLGLCIAREIVTLHGGTIWVQDTPGGGATFVMELPNGE